MLLSDLGDKEIINIHDGAKLGVMADTDLVIDDEGKIRALLLLPRFRLFRSRGGEELEIPWKAVAKIGDDILLVDYRRRGRYY